MIQIFFNVLVKDTFVHFSTNIQNLKYMKTLQNGVFIKIKYQGLPLYNHNQNYVHYKYYFNNKVYQMYKCFLNVHSSEQSEY